MVKTAVLNGINGELVTVEVEILRGLPSFVLVGLPEQSVRESKERVRSAIINSGFQFPLGRIIINLSPSNIKKGGTLLDLPIALAILSKSNQISKKNIDKFLAFGELSLTGEIREVPGALSIVTSGVKRGIYKFIVPNKNCKEAALVKEGEIFGFSTLKEVTNFLYMNNKEPFKEEISYEDEVSDMDFSELENGESIIRAIEIAIGGKHNFLLWGAPGSGKTMVAERIKTVLPRLTYEEAVEVTRIHSSLSGVTGVKRYPPFREPHCTATLTSIIGGTSKNLPGEVTLAHNGVLYFDELLEFSPKVIEALRIPLESKKVILTKGTKRTELPSDFIFISSMNPCPCGFFNTGERMCTCGEAEIKRYLHKISGPILDRMDMFIQCRNKSGIKSSYRKTSEEIKEKIQEIRYIQEERKKKFNGKNECEDLIELCKLSSELQEFLNNFAMDKDISYRGKNKILKLARTISDYKRKTDVGKDELIEAINYRRFISGDVI
ncbi:YifB family Mg chelatase-like AAA ATPase [Clostridium bornimense]|uniref:YifB family Mg chelatase-like AAA ATPase n=1 Tax=Clostridium bornimense TaxID=1216932 RepID=UPI001C119F19|nr:YifB family Mg chelatase-like AAA ATPase [Clostridium bornimense]MBU5317136.1 YifB family Mg chelatase-like AAA ATPase [Clostridium bornimense]